MLARQAVPFRVLPNWIAIACPVGRASRTATHKLAPYRAYSNGVQACLSTSASHHTFSTLTRRSGCGVTCFTVEEGSYSFTNPYHSIAWRDGSGVVVATGEFDLKTDALTIVCNGQAYGQASIDTCPVAQLRPIYMTYHPGPPLCTAGVDAGRCR
jgi:hypothetical protein